eukprot:gnl/MRDRNA2_/MRDRNA2_33724_c0_seq1.p1 gnl/MRDRNA2_/MRDRNA2_33724_c0~~gnl/MRDRNA2_/MRDRNA2_33724_c0_seq1.p1  ORF type:complete len:290 (+),score=32.65 gnl/MRDRNA2_/MRDRNA2_33724_c0_seq1:37-870(+)
MSPDHIGMPFRCNGDVDRSVFEGKCRHREDGSAGRLYHALKYGPRAQLLADANTLGHDVAFCAGLYHCDYAASQWRKWTSVVHLDNSGGLSNGWDNGCWHTLCAHGGVLLILDWDRWPADVLQSRDGGKTWNGKVQNCAAPCGQEECIGGWVVLKRTRCSGEPSKQHVVVEGDYAVVNSSYDVEKISISATGACFEATKGWSGKWQQNGHILVVDWDGAECREVFHTFDGGLTWFTETDPKGLSLARLSTNALLPEIAVKNWECYDASDDEVWEAVS